MTYLVIQFLLVRPLNFVRLAIMCVEANEVKHCVDVIGGTKVPVWHGGIFDSIKNAFFLDPLMHLHLLMLFVEIFMLFYEAFSKIFLLSICGRSERI